MVVKLVSGITVLLLLMFQLAMAGAPIARPNCPDRCGPNIIIPFPFGIGKGCYKDKWFEIECNETAKPPRAYIISIKLEVVDISIGAATVKGPIISFNSSGSREAGLPVNLTGTPFIFSYQNEFVAVGCKTRALMTHIEPYLIGCVSTCKNQSANVDLLGTNICSRKSCCSSSIPSSSSIQVFNPSFEAQDDNQGRNGSWWAFLASDEWFVSNITDPLAVQYMDYVPMELWWVSSELDLSPASSCLQMNDNGSLVAWCDCYSRRGYEGNPYLESGCTDINECEDPKLHSCGWMTKCVNERGGYSCKVNKVWIVLIATGAAIFFVIICLLLCLNCEKSRKERSFRENR